MTRGWGFVVFAVAAVFFPGTAAAQRAWATPGEEEAERARDLAARGNCADALTLYDTAIYRRREDASLRRDRGLCHERLGNAQPARDDFGAYLSMSPGAPDAAQIQARYDALAGPEREPEPPPEQTEEREEPRSATATGEPEEKAELPSEGWLLGAHLGYRDWNSEGMPGQTVSVGLEVGFAYAPVAEIDARFALLDSNELDNSGYGASIVHTFKLGLDDDRRWELSAGLGGGFETQESQLRVRRNYIFGRFTPSVRWSFHPAVVAQGGPELGLGTIPRPSGVLEGDDSAVGIYWGGRVEVLWELRPRR